MTLGLGSQLKYSLLVCILSHICEDFFLNMQLKISERQQGIKVKVNVRIYLICSNSEKLSVAVEAPSELDASTKGIFSCTVGGYPVPDVTITKTDLNNESSVSYPCVKNQGLFNEKIYS